MGIILPYALIPYEEPVSLAILEQDIMRLIWSCSTEEDLRQMKSWCNEINSTRLLAADPLVLSPKPYRVVSILFSIIPILPQWVPISL